VLDVERLNDVEKKQMKDAIVEAGFRDRLARLWQKRPLAIAVAMFVFISVGAYAAVGGGFEFFRDALEAPFIDLVSVPLEGVYAEDQGIRFEVVGAERISSVVLLYMTMQDVNGEDRLPEWLFPDIEIYLNTQQEVSIGGSSSRILYFDEDTNTWHFENQIHVGLDIPNADTMEIVIGRIFEPPPTPGELLVFAEGE